MSCAIPCVVTDVGDSAWIVSDSGRIVPARDPHALADACRALIVLGEDRRREIGLKARQRIIENFSLDSIVAQYEELYRRVLSMEITN
jgi:glycosyltransferase involved in cell wall biosynthesis